MDHGRADSIRRADLSPGLTPTGSDVQLEDRGEPRQRRGANEKPVGAVRPADGRPSGPELRDRSRFAAVDRVEGDDLVRPQRGHQAAVRGNDAGLIRGQAYALAADRARIAVRDVLNVEPRAMTLLGSRDHDAPAVG